MRFLHLADVHLDTPFAGRSSDLRERLQQASREALREAVDLALAEGVHAVLVAGDLFDGEHLSFATERFLLRQLERLSTEGIQVIYATGNHDPARRAGRAAVLEWPETVTVVSGPDPVTVTVTDREGGAVGRVTAAGHETPNEDQDLAAEFPTPEGDLPAVGLLHAQVVGTRGAEAHGRYAPTELTTLQRAGYDYWALGHVHLRQELSVEPPIHYPGNLQGRNPRESGAKGALLVQLGGGAPAVVDFHPLAPVRWERMTVDGLEQVRTLNALAARIEGVWKEVRTDDPGLPGAEWVLRVELRGPSPLHRMLEADEERDAVERDLVARLGLLHAELQVEGLHPPVRPEEHVERQDVLGEALRLLRDVEESGGVPSELVPSELAANPDDPIAYLRSLLDGLDAELVHRMLGDRDGDGR